MIFRNSNGLLVSDINVQNTSLALQLETSLECDKTIVAIERKNDGYYWGMDITFFNNIDRLIRPIDIAQWFIYNTGNDVVLVKKDVDWCDKEKYYFLPSNEFEQLLEYSETFNIDFFEISNWDSKAYCITLDYVYENETDIIDSDTLNDLDELLGEYLDTVINEVYNS